MSPHSGIFFEVVSNNIQNTKELLKWELYVIARTNINLVLTNAIAVHRRAMSASTYALMSLTWQLGKTTLLKWWNVPVSAKKPPVLCHQIQSTLKSSASCAPKSAMSALLVVQNSKTTIAKSVQQNAKNAPPPASQCKHRHSKPRSANSWASFLYYLALLLSVFPWN